MIETRLNPDGRKVLPGCHFEIGVVITDEELRIVLDDTEVKEEAAPRVVTFCRSHKHNGHIVPKVIHAPQKYPVTLLSCYRKVLSVKDKRVGKLIAVGEGKLIVVRKLFKLLLTDPPHAHG